MQARPTPVDEKAQAFVGRTFRRQVHNKLPAGQLKSWACAQHQRANAALWQHTTRIQSIPIQPDQDLVHCLRTSIGGIGRTPITSLFAHGSSSIRVESDKAPIPKNRSGATTPEATKTPPCASSTPASSAPTSPRWKGRGFAPPTPHLKKPNRYVQPVSRLYARTLTVMRPP